MFTRIYKSNKIKAPRQSASRRGSESVCRPSRPGAMLRVFVGSAQPQGRGRGGAGAGADGCAARCRGLWARPGRGLGNGPGRREHAPHGLVWRANSVRYRATLLPCPSATRHLGLLHRECCVRPAGRVSVCLAAPDPQRSFKRGQRAGSLLPIGVSLGRRSDAKRRPCLRAPLPEKNGPH